MQLSLNVTAPVFKLPSVFGQEVDLTAYRGKKVLICFFRHAGCPFCNLRVHTLTKHCDMLKEKNLEMIFFFESPASLIQKSSFHKGVMPIPIISDPQKVWYATYGLEPSRAKSVWSHLTTFITTAINAKIKQLPVHAMQAGESFDTIPAEFLLDEQGIIRQLHYSTNLTDRMAIKDIIAFAEQTTTKVNI